MTQRQMQAQIDSIKTQLVNKYKPDKIILFGSGATGEMTEDSDLDFFIIKDDKRRFHDRMVELYRIIEKDVAADFIIYTPKEVSERLNMGDPFIKSIFEEGKVLYG